MFTESESSTACPVFRLSCQEEAILMIQRLPTRIVPNHDVSQVVNRAIARHKDQVDGLIEIIENEFKSISDDIERQIFNACQELIKTLNVLDNSLSGILKSRNSSDFMESDFLQKSFKKMNDMVDQRNNNINNFMNTLHGLEKKRTSMIEKCYNQHMLVIKRLSCDSFEKLYKKYLENYNIIKFNNFRTYEDVRFKLVQLNGNLQRDFLLKTHDVKMKIKENTEKSFLDKLRVSTESTMWDKIRNFQTKSINFTNTLSHFFHKIIQTAENKFNFAFVIECSDLLKSHLKDLEKIINSMSPLHDEIINDVQRILTNTMGELNQILMNSGESLSPAESVAIFEEMITIANKAQGEKIKTIMDIQLFLRDVKEAIKIINTVLSPAMEIFYGHSKRITKARHVVLLALDRRFIKNDLKLNELENNFNTVMNSLVEASSKNEVLKCEKMCENILQNIKNKIETNQNSENDILSNYNDLMASELEVTKLEVQAILSLYPDNLKPLPEFDSAMKIGPRKKFIEKSINFFKSTMVDCQYSLYERLLTLVSELKSDNLLNNECEWITLLNHTIYGRFGVAKQVLEFRTSKLRGGTVKKRLDEIEEHRNLIERHIKVVQEISASLKDKTNELYEKFYEKKKTIENKNRNFEINELSSAELCDLIDEHKNQIHLVAREFHDNLKSHAENIEAGYQEIINLTLEYMKFIRMFPEGGNYSYKEAVSIVNILSDLSNKMFEEKIEDLKLLRPIGYESLTEIKESLSVPIKTLEIELEKNKSKQKYLTINKLIDVSIDREYLNLYKMRDALRMKLNDVEKTFKENDVKRSAKCWSEILTETKGFIDFLVESYRDIRALLKSEIRNSIWNTKFEKSFVSSKISANSKHAFYNGKLKFYDYCKTIFIHAETTGGPRFLNNIYQTIFHYVFESQSNAADLASIEQANTWIGTDRPDVTQVYHEIMGDVVKKSKSTALRAELIWVFELSDFFDFLAGLRETESKFKNIVLATYHEESVMKLDRVFEASERETALLRKRLKDIRERLHSKLKISHGHPRNVEALDALLNEFRRVRQDCLESLADACNRIGSDLEKIAENYETQCPINILKAASLSVECHSSLQTRLDHINTKSTAIDLSFTDFESEEPRVVSDALERHVSSSENGGVKAAVQNVKQHLRSTSDTVFWPKNSQLWADNVRVFMKLYRDRVNDVQIYNAVEKSKLVDWTSAFVRDVEHVKTLHL